MAKQNTGSNDIVTVLRDTLVSETVEHCSVCAPQVFAMASNCQYVTFDANNNVLINTANVFDCPDAVVSFGYDQTTQPKCFTNVDPINVDMHFFVCNENSFVLNSEVPSMQMIFRVNSYSGNIADRQVVEMTTWNAVPLFNKLCTYCQTPEYGLTYSNGVPVPNDFIHSIDTSSGALTISTATKFSYAMNIKVHFTVENNFMCNLVVLPLLVPITVTTCNANDLTVSAGTIVLRHSLQTASVVNTDITQAVYTSYFTPLCSACGPPTKFKLIGANNRELKENTPGNDNVLHLNSNNDIQFNLGTTVFMDFSLEASYAKDHVCEHVVDEVSKPFKLSICAADSFSFATEGFTGLTLSFK